MEETMLQEQNTGRSTFSAVIEKIVTVFMLGYGLSYFGYFLRERYRAWFATLELDEGYAHLGLYSGHIIFLAVMILYALAVKPDRKYIFSFAKGSPLRNMKYALLGALTGFLQMGVCILAASLNGDLTIKPVFGITVPLFLAGLGVVLMQATTEEIESRGFVFGKMNNEGVPLIPAAAVSAFFFSYLHAANPGFGFLPLFSLFTIGVFYALSCYYFGTIWFACLAHTLWNFTQDFIFGLPDSGNPAAMSLFSTEVNGSGFFYDETFGIEGSIMAIVVNIVMCLIVVAIGTLMRRKAKKQLPAVDQI